MWLYVACAVAVPVSLILAALTAEPTLVFVASCVAIVPLAGLMGRATEELAKHLGAHIGGLLNASFGNATELIIAVFALREELFGVVKATITGSILGNLLLVFGVACIAGGWRREKQTFSPVAAGANAAMLLVAVIALLVPSLFAHAARPPITSGHALERLSLWVAVVLIASYGLSLLFSLRTHRPAFSGFHEFEPPQWKMAFAAGMLLLATFLVAVESEILVKAVEPLLARGHLSELFVGVIIIPVIGNAAEHAGAVLMALRDKMDIAIGIAVGSSTQIALFVAPALVFIAYALGHPMTYTFAGSEVLAVTASVAIVNFIAQDGETNWFEGVQLVAAYAIIALAFLLLPGIPA